MTVKDIKEAINNLPDDMLVGSTATSVNNPIKLRPKCIVYCETAGDWYAIQSIAFKSGFRWAGDKNAKYQSFSEKNCIYFDAENILRYSNSDYLETVAFKNEYRDWKLFNASDLFTKYLIQSL